METTVGWVDGEIKKHLETVRLALDAMHLEMTSTSEKKKRAARERHATRQGITLPKFSEGDFVLAATTTGSSGNKLALVWRGPKRIVTALNDYTFEVQDLVAPFTVSVRHASRLQLYRDAGRGVQEELVEQAIHGEGGHLVEALKACRLSPSTHRWEVQVKWYGLDDIESSWEPAEAIQQDVPVLFKAFVDAQPGDANRTKMEAAMAAMVARQAPTPTLPRERRGGKKKQKAQ